MLFKHAYLLYQNFFWHDCGIHCLISGVPSYDKKRTKMFTSSVLVGGHLMTERFVCRGSIVILM